VIDWSEVARQFWGPRFEVEKQRGLNNNDFKTRYAWQNISPMRYGYYRDAGCKRAAERISNFGRCMREAGMLAMLDKRYR
jgi:hypothetical protein